MVKDGISAAPHSQAERARAAADVSLVLDRVAFEGRAERARERAEDAFWERVGSGATRTAALGVGSVVASALDPVPVQRQAEGPGAVPPTSVGAMAASASFADPEDRSALRRPEVAQGMAAALVRLERIEVSTRVEHAPSTIERARYLKTDLAVQDQARRQLADGDAGVSPMLSRALGEERATAMSKGMRSLPSSDLTALSSGARLSEWALGVVGPSLARSYVEANRDLDRETAASLGVESRWGMKDLFSGRSRARVEANAHLVERAAVLGLEREAGVPMRGRFGAFPAPEPVLATGGAPKPQVPAPSREMARTPEVDRVPPGVPMTAAARASIAATMSRGGPGR